MGKTGKKKLKVATYLIGHKYGSGAYVGQLQHIPRSSGFAADFLKYRFYLIVRPSY